MYIGIGSGHKSAAFEIKRRLNMTNKNIEIKCEDLIDKKYPIMLNIVKRLYLFILNNSSFVWEFLYDSNQSEIFNKWMIKILSSLLKKRIREDIENFNPDVIVITHAFYGPLVSTLKKNKVKLIGVVTDFHAHNYWVEKSIDKYFVANEEAKENLVKNGINQNKIIISGIPIRDRILRNNIKNDFRILICGGGEGIGKMTEIIKILKNEEKNIRIYAIAGKNKKLEKKLRKLLKEKNNSEVFGYTDRLGEIMANSSLYIGSAGGLIISELLSQNVPMLFYKPLRGQERMNAKYIERKGAGKIIYSKKDLKKYLREILLDSSILAKMRERTKEISKPYAASIIVKNIMK